MRGIEKAYLPQFKASFVAANSPWVIILGGLVAALTSYPSHAGSVALTLSMRSAPPLPRKQVPIPGPAPTQDSAAS